MTDNVLATWSPFLYDLEGAVQEMFPSEAPFMAELSGYDAKAKGTDHHSPFAGSPGRWTRPGDFLRQAGRHPIILAGLTGGGFVQENSTWNVPHALQDNEVHINLVRLLFPFSVSSTSSVTRSTTRPQRGDDARHQTPPARRMENLALVATAPHSHRRSRAARPAPSSSRSEPEPTSTCCSRHGLGHPHPLDGCRCRSGLRRKIDAVSESAARSRCQRPRRIRRRLGQHHLLGFLGLLHPGLLVERHHRPGTRRALRPGT